MMIEEDPCECGHDLVRHDMGHGCIECRCRGFRDVVPSAPPAEAQQDEARCRACGHGPERHDPEVPGCIECHCQVYRGCDEHETDDRLEYLGNLARAALAARSEIAQ